MEDSSEHSKNPDDTSRKDSSVDDQRFKSSLDPKAASFTDIVTASLEIKDSIKHTACSKSSMSGELGMEVYLKKEILQVTGSFKERGAACALKRLTPEQRAQGVIAASAGNHALALSYHGQQQGVPVTVVTPLNAPLAKVNTCKKYEATVIQHGENFAECKVYAQKVCDERKLTYINGYDHPNVIAGQGSVGLEILEQVRDVDAIIVPTGGAGLIAGVATAVKRISPHVKIIGVEAEACPSMSRALKAQKPVLVESVSSLADGLGVPLVGVNAFESCKGKIDEMIMVKEDTIALAILRLLEEEKVVCEGAGAIGLAAILSGQLDHFRGKKVVVLLCGGNIDITVLGRCIDRGLAAEGRLVKCVVQVSDRPGGIANIVNVIAKLGGSIKDIHHERAWVTSNVYQVQNTFVIETNDRQHAKDIVDEIQRGHQLISHTLKHTH